MIHMVPQLLKMMMTNWMMSLSLPVITHGSQFETLKIFDLPNLKLLACFATKVLAPLATTAQLAKSAWQKKKAPAWSDEN